MFSQRFIPATVLLLAIGLPARAESQIPITVGVRGGQSVVLSGGKTGAHGGSFDLRAAYRINPAIAVYLTGGGTGLGGHKDADSLDLSVYSTTVGMTMLMGPLSVGRPAPWIGGGIGLYSLAATRDFPQMDEQSRVNIGFDVGGGLVVAITPTVDIVPAVRLAMFSPDFTFQDRVDVDQFVTRSVGTVSYLTFDIGVNYNFGIKGRR